MGGGKGGRRVGGEVGSRRNGGVERWKHGGRAKGTKAGLGRGGQGKEGCLQQCLAQPTKRDLKMGGI